jgi:hypothetical protein
MLYLANIEVRKSYYKGEDETETINHIVEAESEGAVKDKLYNYYEDKDSIFYVTHYISFNYINEVIS